MPFGKYESLEAYKISHAISLRNCADYSYELLVDGELGEHLVD
jgi:hypothetical protein